MTEVWRGRLGGLDPRAQALNDSLPVDRRLWPEELALTRAYASALVECGVMTADEASSLVAAADQLENDLEHGTVALEGEDVHSAVEVELTRRSGDPARKLHTGRSRNDQVATLLRMYVMQQCDTVIEAVRDVERAIAHQARLATDIPVAAYTHMQPAQPVLMAHTWLAHAAALERDEARFEEAREAAGVLPLGAGAVAGTPLYYDRAAVAMRLGFSRLASNSIDAVGDRDFALQFLQSGAQLGIHLSRLAEDLVLWCSPAFGWFSAPDGFSTGSSLLPQKRNPDVFELTRGKSARLIGNAERLAVLLKGLPSSYQKDLQEDKEVVFDTADTLDALLAALAPAITALAPNVERMAATLTPDLLAIELADSLTESGVPFRDVHALVGKLWAAAESKATTPQSLPEHERLAISAHFTDAKLAALSVEKALQRRDHAPGTGPTSVARQLARLEARLGLSAGDPDGDVGENGKKRLNEGIFASSFARRGVVDAAGGASEASGSQGWRSEPGCSEAEQDAEPSGPLDASAAKQRAQEHAPAALVETRPDGITLRRAKLADVAGIATVMADYVVQGTLLPRSTSELFQCIREFHVAEHDGAIVACAALRLLWIDLGEVRSLAVHPDYHGRDLGQQLVQRVVDDARSLEIPRIIALTRETPFFERCGFAVQSREDLPRKVWTDCVRCPRRHACDEVAVVLDLVPGASEAARAEARSWAMPMPPPARTGETLLPVIS